MGKSLVLNFHNEKNGDLFEKMIVALKSDYNLVDIQFLERSFDNNQEFKNTCHITFDDGERSFYNTVFPLLKKHRVPATLFVCPDMISSETNYWFQELNDYDSRIMKALLAKKLNVGIESLADMSFTEILKALPVADILNVIKVYQQENAVNKKPSQNMTLAQLKEVEASGLVTIGAHTLNHPILKNESDSSSENEISGSINKLAELLGHPIKYFAYPNGRPELDFGEREINYLKKNNISIAFSTQLDHLRVTDNRLSIPRMGYASMGLKPGNPLIVLRMQLGKRWFNTHVNFMKEKDRREKIKSIIAKAT